MDKISSFGERLKAQLIEKGLSQADISRLACIDRSMVSKYIKGTKNPKIETIRRCAAVLYVNPEWLEGYNVEKDPQPVALSPLENDLILCFRSCGAADKYAIIEFVKAKGAK